MIDREKVIDRLEKAVMQMHGPRRYTREDVEELEMAGWDALALLREQEPKMVVQTTSTIRCPGCGKQITSKGALHKEIKYCWKCGQAVKWDG